MQAQISPRKRSSLFIASLAYESTEEDLLKLFSPFGDISDVKIMRTNSVSKCLNYGFVNFMTVKSATQAKNELNGKSLHGEALRIGWAQAKGGMSKSKIHKIRSCQVHVSYMAEQTDTEVSRNTIFNLFSPFGHVIEVAIVLSKTTTNKEQAHRQCGHGFVHFALTCEGIESAHNAIKTLSKQTINGVHIDYKLTRMDSFDSFDQYTNKTTAADQRGSQSYGANAEANARMSGSEGIMRPYMQPQSNRGNSGLARQQQQSSPHEFHEKASISPPPQWTNFPAYAYQGPYSPYIDGQYSGSTSPVPTSRTSPGLAQHVALSQQQHQHQQQQHELFHNQWQVQQSFSRGNSPRPLGNGVFPPQHSRQMYYPQVSITPSLEKQMQHLQLSSPQQHGLTVALPPPQQQQQQQFGPVYVGMQSPTTPSIDQRYRYAPAITTTAAEAQQQYATTLPGSGNNSSTAYTLQQQQQLQQQQLLYNQHLQILQVQQQAYSNAYSAHSYTPPLPPNVQGSSHSYTPVPPPHVMPMTPSTKMHTQSKSTRYAAQKYSPLPQRSATNLSSGNTDQSITSTSSTTTSTHDKFEENRTQPGSTTADIETIEKID